MNIFKILKNKKGAGEKSTTHEGIRVPTKSVINANDRVKVFTHNDLSGAICSAICKYSYCNVDVSYCSNSEINDCINTFMLIDKGFELFDKIIIVDVSLTKDTVATIDMFIETMPEKDICYINHKNCNMWIDNKSWSIVQSQDNDITIDSTYLLKKYIEREEDCSLDKLLRFIEISRLYTTWEWTEKDANEANYLNLLCDYSEMELFVRDILYKMNNELPVLNEDDIINAKYIKEKYTKYLNEKKGDVILKKIIRHGKLFKIAIVAAEKHTSKLAADLNKLYKLDATIVLVGLKELKIKISPNSDISTADVSQLFEKKNIYSKTAEEHIPVAFQEKIIDSFLEEFII